MLDVSPPAITLLIAAGLLNGFAQPFVGLLTGEGPGFEPLVIMVAPIALLRIHKDSRHLRLPLWAAVAYGLALMIPSSTVAWGATALLAAGLALPASAEGRAGQWLAAGLCGVMVWQAQALNWLGIWLVMPDAAVTQHLLGLLWSGVERQGNMLGWQGGHQIVVLAGCSTLLGLPLVMLGAVAASSMTGHTPARGVILARALAAGGMFVALNLIRLVLLAWTADFYKAVHGDVGQNVFDALVIAMLLLSAGRPSRTRLAHA